MSRIRITFLCVLTASGAIGCPQPPDDGFEPNDTLAQATKLTLDTEFKARAVQGNPDVLKISLDEANVNMVNQLEFDLATVSGQVCPAFTVTAPDGSILYQDTNAFCSREFSTPVTAPGASLTAQNGSFILLVPPTSSGNYFFTIEEKGQADNVIDYVWSYQITPHLVD